MSMSINDQRIMRSQLSDNRPNGAQKIRVLSGTKSFRDSVDANDKVDFYSFKLTGSSNFKLSLSRLKSNVDVFLSKGKRVIARSEKGGKRPEAIDIPLDAGKYFVQVNQKQGASRYRLRLSASPLPGSTPNPNPPSPGPSVRKLVSLGRPAVSFLARYGLIDLSTGSIETLPTGNSVGLNLVDIASSSSGTFAIDNLSNFYRVDLNTGNSTRIGDLGSLLSEVGYTSLGFDASGTLYTIGTNKRTRQSALYTVNVAAGGQVTLVANLPGIVDIGDIVYDAASSRFFASTNTASANSLLYSVSLTGNTQLIGNIGFSGIGALLFENGALYGYTNLLQSPQQQIIINTTTGAGTFDKQVTADDSSFTGVTGGA